MSYYNDDSLFTGKSVAAVIGILVVLFLLYAVTSSNSDPGYTEDSQVSQGIEESQDYSYDSGIYQSGFKSIGDVGNSELIYDVDTKIVYIKTEGYYSYYTLCPYYAENGLPYRYDTETGSLSMIWN